MIGAARAPTFSFVHAALWETPPQHHQARALYYVSCSQRKLVNTTGIIGVQIHKLATSAIPSGGAATNANFNSSPTEIYNYLDAN